MIIQNVSAGQGAIPVRQFSNDAPAVVADTSAAVAPQQPSTEQLKSAVANINKAMQQSNQSLEFSVDPNTKTPVVKMMDTETGKVISQFPSEQVIAIAQSIDEYLSQHQLQGLLLKQKA